MSKRVFDRLSCRPGDRAAWFPIAALTALALATAACAAPQQSRVTVAPPRIADAAPADSAATAPDAGSPSSPSAVPSIRVRITDDRGTRIVNMALDDYVLGAVRAELPPHALQNDVLIRLLQVQAIVSRTYALANLHRHEADGFDLCDSTHCQLYRAKLAAESRTDPAARAVADTHGQIITYEGRVIQALFHSSCGGHTTAASTVWGGADVPYLRPVPDWFCTRNTASGWQYATDGAALRRALNSEPRTSVGSRLTRIDVVERDPSGRAVLVSLDGDRTPMVRAEEFRSVMRRVFGQRSLRSTWFTVKRDGPQFVFTGVGYGHGVGLCQTGASERAQAGQSPADIIKHYFPGTRLQSASLAVLVPSQASQHLGH
ncbi:MAG: SpoIID/LytB domain-containing protein [Acidobacteria bacterium]|nr:SpoIID/LytB domain-containing protein [Acidobacteriota bacterium]